MFARKSDPYRSLLPVKHTTQVAHGFDASLAAFDLNDDLVRLARLRVAGGMNLPVNAVVGAFLLLDGPSAYQVQGPPVELKLVLFGQDERLVGWCRLADDADNGFGRDALSPAVWGAARVAAYVGSVAFGVPVDVNATSTRARVASGVRTAPT